MDDGASLVAVVTGASAGMGYAHAAALAKARFRVVAVDRDEQGLRTLKQDDKRIVTVCADVTDERAVNEAFFQIVSGFGRIDALVNNAGAATATDCLAETPLAAWEADLRLNLTSQFLCIRAVLQQMMGQKAGSIINIATTSAFSGITAALYRTGGTANLVPYVAAKAGVIGMTRALAREVASHGIRVNAVAPGFTPTPRVKAAFPQAAIARMVDDQARKQVLEPYDATGAVIFLAGDSSRAITGQVLKVDHGGSMG